MCFKWIYAGLYANFAHPVAILKDGEYIQHGE